MFPTYLSMHDKNAPYRGGEGRTLSNSNKQSFAEDMCKRKKESCPHSDSIYMQSLSCLHKLSKQDEWNSHYLGGGEAIEQEKSKLR